jgi:hypothetical protein
MKQIVLFIFVVFASFAFGQIGGQIEKRHNDRKNQKQFSDSKSWGDIIWSYNSSQYRNLGWHASVGLTYMAGNNENDQDQAYDLKANGLPGYYLEGGMEHLIKKRNKILHYVDWGLGIKHFGGQETYELDDFKDRGNFNFGSVFARASIHNIAQLSKYNFLDNSIGINLDYRIYGGKDNQAEGKYLSPLPSNNQERLVLQLNYALGFGIKVKDGLFFVPTIQTPVLTLLQFNDFNPGHRWFNSRYQPLIFTVKMAWLLPKKGCPAVFGGDKQQQENYEMQ